MEIKLSKELNATISVRGIVAKVLEGQTATAIYGYAGQRGAVKRVS